jgi:hypothetical protein
MNFDMKLHGVMVPLPSFASIAITYAEIADWLKVLTLLFGLGTSIVIFMSWLSKRRQGRQEEALLGVKLEHERRQLCAACITGQLIHDKCIVPRLLRPSDCPRINYPDP